MAHAPTSPIDLRQTLLDVSARPLALPSLLQGYGVQLFYGDLHNHTSYSDGRGRPEDALRQMRERGLHFAAITDHSEFLNRALSPGEPDRWNATGQQVAALTGKDFVGWRGFEWSSPDQGHSNVWCSAAYTDYEQTGDTSIRGYYNWLADAQPIPGAQVLAGFNHPGREPACFDRWAFSPQLDDRLITLECFNRDEEYGQAYFQALDHGWHVGAIGVSDHHGDDWGNQTFPRAGVFAPSLSLPDLQAALLARRVFATRSSTLTLCVVGNTAFMGSRLQLPAGEPLRIGVWCDDLNADRTFSRCELWTNGEKLLAVYELRGLHCIRWQITVPPQVASTTPEHWFVIRVLSNGETRAYSSPIWVRWQTTKGNQSAELHSG